jgi:hypothetical protein
LAARFSLATAPRTVKKASCSESGALMEVPAALGTWMNMKRLSFERIMRGD